MAVTLLLLIIFLCLPDLEANYLTGFSHQKQSIRTIILNNLCNPEYYFIMLGARAK
jgi:hypothetical protein